MTQLRAVPAGQDRPRRMLGVVRVSKEREGMASPEQQEHAIRTAAAARGHVLLEPLLYGLDESGSQRRSAWWRKLDDAVEQVEQGEADGIIVWKFSRVARQRLKWNVAVDRVESAGGVLESATEDFDTTTSAGRFARGMTAEMNAFQAEMIGEGWIETHERRVRAGLPHTGRRRWGYEYDRVAKIHRPHPEQGPLLAELYRRYVAGESIYALVRWLNAHGWASPAGAGWSYRGLLGLLDNGFAAGLFRYRGELHQGVHEPLIDADLWQAYLDARAARRRLPARVERSAYLLSGLVRCARCGHSMAANKIDPGTKLHKNGKRYSAGRLKLIYRCEHGVGSGLCRGGSIKMAIVEEHVLGYLRELAAEVDQRAAGRVVVDARHALLEQEEKRLARELQKAADALVRLALRDAEQRMPAAIYEKARAELEERRTTLREAMEAAGRTHRRAARDRPAEAAQLLASWDVLPVSGRREILRGLIDCVLVGTGPEPYLRVVEWSEARG